MSTPKSNSRTKIWTDEEFARWFKAEASKEGMSMLEFSRKIAKEKMQSREKSETFKFGL